MQPSFLTECEIIQYLTTTENIKFPFFDVLFLLLNVKIKTYNQAFCKHALIISE